MSQDPVFLNFGVDRRSGEALVDPQRLNAYRYAANNPIILIDDNGQYARNSSTGYVGLHGYGLRALENTGGVARAYTSLSAYQDEILKYPNADLINAIIHEEQSHGFDDMIFDRTPFGSTVGLGQIRVNDSRSNQGYVALTRSQLLDPATNIRDISHRITVLGAALRDIGITRSNSNYAAYVGSAYNSQKSLGSITDYGRRVEAYTNDFNTGTPIVPDSVLTIGMILDNLARFISSKTNS